MPEERGLLFAVHNNAHNRAKGAMNRDIGVVAGVSDMIYLAPNEDPLFIEIKTPEGRQSKAQRIWQKKIELVGYDYYVVRSLEEMAQVCGWDL